MSKRPKPPTKQAPPPAPTIADIATGLEISTRRVSQLKTAGMPVDSLKSAQAWRAAQIRTSPGDSVEQLRQRRIGLLKQQERRAKLEADERQGLLISRVEAELHASRIGFAMAAALRALETELPQLCLGLPLERCRPIVKERVRAIQGMLADAQNSRFWPETIP